MSTRIKDILGIVLIGGIVIFAFAAWQYVSSYSKSVGPGAYRTFAVSAEGESVAIPDIAQFTFSVITQGGTNIASLQQQNVERTNTAIEFLKDQGVEDKDIRTSRFSLDPRYQSISCPRPFGGEPVVCPPASIVGYTVTQTVQVKVRDFSKVGSIVSGVVENGANSVSQLSFTIDDLDAVQNEARAEAIAKAKEKAEALAEAGGFRLGRLISLNEGGGYPYYAAYEQGDAGGFGGAAPVAVPAPRIEPGSQEVLVSVTLTYEIR